MVSVHMPFRACFLTHHVHVQSIVVIGLAAYSVDGYDDYANVR